MEQYDINGVSVKFPFVPYPVQRNYMAKVIESIENKQNALLESPTGTGKTQSLLCASLAWVEKNYGRIPGIQFVTESSHEMSDEIKAETSMNNSLNISNEVKIWTKPGNIHPKVIYTSRTHSQILQAMNEQKRTEYSYIRGAVIASRSQLCVRPELKMKSNSDKSYNCKSLVKKNQCSYYTNVHSALKTPELKQTIIDIEDLDRIGEKFDCCPYFVSKEVLQKAQIIYMPYNYLIDPKIRSAIKIDFSDSIVIIDEAHNINAVCEQCASTAITSTAVGIAVRDLKYIAKNIDDGIAGEYYLTVAEVNTLASSVRALNITLNDMQIDSYGNHPGSYIFELLKKAKITEGNSSWITDLLDKLMLFLTDKARTDQKCPAGKGLNAILQFLETIFPKNLESIKDHIDQCYKVHIKHDTSLEKPAIIVDLWCFSPAIMMKHLLRKQIRCLILTSGTLAPLKALAAEMEIPFEVQLTNPHIIQKTQICAKIVSYGVGHEMLDSCYKNRLNQKYISSLGLTIVEFAKVVPDGLLVFFPSYTFMDKFIRAWKTHNIWPEMLKHKPIFIEPDTKEKLKLTMNEYYAKINQNKGAIFMAVLRGKVSEGLDFADMYGRGVVITGIPFAPYKEPKVELKQKYLDGNLERGRETISGRQWYSLDAIRAVNQAIGRVIRHKDDYGAILLCDHRFNQNIQYISTWVKNNLDNRQCTFDRTIEELTTFFTTAENTLPKPIPKIQLEDSIDDDEMPNCTFHPTQFLTDTLYTTSNTQLLSDTVNTSNINNESSSVDDSTSSDSSAYESDHERPNRSRKRKVSNSSASTSVARVKSEPSTSRAVDSNSDDEAQVNVKLERKKGKFKRELNEEAGESGINRAIEDSILSFLEHVLDAAKYKELVQCQIKYKSDAEYKCYRDSLFNIFREEHLIMNLKGMTLLLRPNHQEIFKIDFEAFMQSRSS